MSVTLNPAVELPKGEEDLGIQRRHWTREEYYRAAEAGIFRPGERLELIKGEVFQKVSPQKRPHMSAVTRGLRALQAAFGANHYITPQGPLILPDDTEPEPDLLVAPGVDEEYTDHPTYADAALVIEISDTTLRYDMGGKAALYAEAGIQDYWVEDLNSRCVYVHRDPAALPDGPFGFGYRSIVRYEEGEAVSPLAAPEASIRVADLLPRAPAC